MKKTLIGIGITLLVLIIIAFIAVTFFAGSIIKSSVEKIAPGILGVPVTVEDIDVRIFGGKVKVQGLIVGNPEKFKSDYLFSLGELSIDIDMGSLSTDTIIVNEVLITAPKISYEMALGSSNIGALLDNLAKEEEEEEEEEKEEEEKPIDPDAAPAKKVIIKKILLTDGKVSINVAALGGKGLTLPLPKVEMLDVGKEEEGGASLLDVISEIISAIAKSVVKVASGSIDLLGDGAKAALDLTSKSVSAVGDAAGATLHAAGDAAGATVGLAGDAAGATVDAAGDAAKAVGKGAGKVVGGVTGIFKKDKDKEEK